MTQVAEGFVASWVRQLRIHHWVKNLILFLPALAAHDWSVIFRFEMVFGFLGVSLLSSTNYIFNDLRDLLRDSSHPLKKGRALVKGALSASKVKRVGFICGILGLGLTSLVAQPVLWGGACLLFLGFLYSHFVSGRRWLDLLFLPTFYLLRLWIGSQITSTPLSFWILIAFFIFILGMGCLKRAYDLLWIDSNIYFKAYQGADGGRLQQISLLCVILLQVLFIFYAFSENATRLYLDSSRILILSIFLGLWFFDVIRKIKKLKLNGSKGRDFVRFIMLDCHGTLFGIGWMAWMILSSKVIQW